MSFNFGELPCFTITHIEMINKLNPKAYKINNPKLTIPLMYPHMPIKQAKAPSAFSTFVGYIVAQVARTGINLPDRLASYVALICSGNFEKFPDISKVKAGWIADFYVGQGNFVEARFLKINHQDFLGAILVTDLARKDLFQIGATFPFMGGYWGERARLVYDSSRDWQKVAFVPQDSTRHYPDGKTEVVKGGWDHEHCEICGQTISLFESGNEYGYQDQNDSWVCLTCYDQYVFAKSLDFIMTDKVF
jgi:hypothetical protein